MKFSIITVVKNSEDKIEKTIKSIISQSYRNFEYIVIHGLSKDNTINIIKKYSDNINTFINEKDEGIYHAMNKGLNLAKGEVIVFVNSGDTLEYNALEIISKYFKDFSNIEFIFGTVERKYLKDTIIKTGFNSGKIKYNFDFATCHSTGFFIKNTSQKILGLYDTTFDCSADYDLFYRMIVLKKMRGLSTLRNEIIGRVDSGGFSSKYGFFKHLLEENRIRIKHKQNFILILVITINKIIKKFYKDLIYFFKQV